MEIKLNDITKVKELKLNEIVEGFLFIEGFEYRLKKGDETWTVVNLSDGDYGIVGKYWDGKLELENKSVLKFQGRVGEYNNRLELTLMKVEPLEVEDEDLPTKVDVRKYYNNIQALRNYIKDEDFLNILDHFIFEKDLKNELYIKPAAVSHHHNYRGGLSEHIFEVASIAYYISNIYPNLNKDLILTGALLHDIGKLKVYGIDKLAPKYDEIMGMQEHLYLGVEMVRDFVRESNLKIGSEKLNLLLNIIGSHHLRGEWGAIFKPCTKEAYIVHYADMISSRINYFSISEEPNSDYFNVFSDDMKFNMFTTETVNKIIEGRE